MMVSTEANSQLVCQSALAATSTSGDPVSRDISGASRRMDEGNENLVYPSLWDFKRSLTCRKILGYGTSDFPSEGFV
jgi:hypothetical protein